MISRADSTAMVRSACVLIVEDNPLNMEPFSALVASQGYRVLQATEGWRGMDLAHQENPDLIIMVFSYQPRRGPDLTHSLKLKINTGDTRSSSPLPMRRTTTR